MSGSWAVLLSLNGRGTTRAAAGPRTPPAATREGPDFDEGSVTGIPRDRGKVNRRPAVGRVGGRYGAALTLRPPWGSARYPGSRRSFRVADRRGRERRR